MENYLSKYGKKKMFQQGGEVPAQSQSTPNSPGDSAGGPNLDEMLAQYAQTKDPQIAVAICDILVQQMGLGGQSQPGGTPMGRYGIKVPLFPKSILSGK